MPLEVISNVREKVGEDFVLGCRFLSEECITGGSSLEDAVYFGVEFAKAGLDFISISRVLKYVNDHDVATYSRISIVDLCSGFGSVDIALN